MKRNMTESEVVTLLLREELSQQVIRELGYQDESPETQAELISTVGELISQQIYLDIGLKLPSEKRTEYQELIGKNNVDAMREFLDPYIPDLNTFLEEAARVEFVRIKEKLEAKLKEGK